MKFKRFLIMDLYHPLSESGEWIDANKKIPFEDGIYKVKSEDGTENFAYFCKDKCCIYKNFFKFEPTYWWLHKQGTPLYDVKYWKARES